MNARIPIWINRIGDCIVWGFGLIKEKKKGQTPKAGGTRTVDAKTGRAGHRDLETFKQFEMKRRALKNELRTLTDKRFKPGRGTGDGETT